MRGCCGFCFCGFFCALLSTALFFVSGVGALAINAGSSGIGGGAVGRMGGASGIFINSASDLGVVSAMLCAGAGVGIGVGAGVCADVGAGIFTSDSKSGSGVLLASFLGLDLLDFGRVGVKLIPPPRANVKGLASLADFSSDISCGFSALLFFSDAFSSGLILSAFGISGLAGSEGFVSATLAVSGKERLSVAAGTSLTAFVAGAIR